MGGDSTATKLMSSWQWRFVQSAARVRLRGVFRFKGSSRNHTSQGGQHRSGNQPELQRMLAVAKDWADLRIRPWIEVLADYCRRVAVAEAQPDMRTEPVESKN